MYEKLTKYAGTLADRKLSSYLGCGTAGLEDFVDDFYALEGFADVGYDETIAQYGIDASGGVECCDVEHVNLDLLAPVLRDACGAIAFATASLVRMPRMDFWIDALCA